MLADLEVDFGEGSWFFPLRPPQGSQPAVCLFPGVPTGGCQGPSAARPRQRAAGCPPAPRERRRRGDRDSIGHNERGGSADMSLTPPPAAIWCRKQPCGDGVLLLLCACPPPLLPAGVPGVRPGLPSASPRAHLAGDGTGNGGGCGGTICRATPQGPPSRGPPGEAARPRRQLGAGAAPRGGTGLGPLPARCRLH